MPHSTVSDDPLPPWRALLRGARQREGRVPAARWLQLATTAPDGTPRVRTLVFRGWAGGATLDLLTDARSAKASELAAQPAVEICWLLPRARSQFRLRGRVCALPSEITEQQLLRHWRDLTPSGRALWGWPAPGLPLQSEAPFPTELADDTPMPEQFRLLRIPIDQVELLELGALPHRRRRWRRQTDWAEEPLNP